MRYKHLIIFAIISLAILFPLLFGKYILTLDTIVSPTAIFGGKSLEGFIYGTNLGSPNAGELGLGMARLPLAISSLVLKTFIPTFILQKIEVFLIFFLSMCSMYSLIQTKKQSPRYFAAFLYAVNPFTYTRFMAGHWGLLLGYAVFPLFIKEITKRELKIKNTALWLSLISILSTHMLAMAFIVLLIFIRKPFKKYLWIFPLFILLNVYWLYPALSAKTTTISIIDRDDIAAFISRNHFVNILITNAMLYGFWRAKAYLMPSMFLLAPLFVIILYLVVHGSLYADFRFKKRFLIMAVIALIISVGVAHPLTLGIYEWFFEIAFMRGFREPNKFIALLSLSYCVLGAYGLEQIRGKKMMAALVLPFLFTPVLFTLNRQLTPIDYPADYYEMNDFLNKDKDDFNILFLPWHLYLDFRWIENRDRRIANPSGIFFDKPVIKGDNMELYPIYSHSLNPISRYVEENLGSARNLSLINIRYILIAKEYNLSIKDATKVKETENLILLKNNQETHKFLQSDDLKAFHKLEYRKKSAISYELESDMKYIIFTEAYDTNW